MYSKRQLAEALEATMVRELEYLNKYLEGEKLLRKGLLLRSWEDIREHSQKLEKISGFIHDEDLQREALVQQIELESGLKNTKSFYDIIAFFDDADREILIRLYYQMKTAISGIQGLTRGLERYIDMKTNLMKDMLEQAYPADTGGVYNRSGMVHRGDSTSVLLNRHL